MVANQGSKPPRFTRWQPPRQTAKSAHTKRLGPRKQGYDARWDRLSVAFRRRNPFCAECAFRGLTTLTAVSGHVIPVSDRPDLRLEWTNLRPLCVHCNSTMAVMEAFARARGWIDRLPEWCADPMRRPLKFRPVV